MVDVSRPLRIEFPGALYHVSARGDGCEDIFLDKGDRLVWLEILESVCRRMNWVCHAYCQMTNHYHLVIETPEPNLSAGMCRLNGVYARRWNKKHGRVGHVFQARFKSILIEKDTYLLEVARYVVLNPVRAGAAREAGEWDWSSYRAMTGQDSAPPWLTIDWLLSQFGTRRTEAIDAYVDFVQSGVGEPDPWRNLKNEIFLGGTAFVSRMERFQEEARDLAEIPRAQRRPEPEPLELFESRYPHRKEAMARAYLSGGYSLSAIANYFRVHYSTVSRAAQYREKAMT